MEEIVLDKVHTYLFIQANRSRMQGELPSGEFFIDYRDLTKQVEIDEVTARRMVKRIVEIGIVEDLSPNKNNLTHFKHKRLAYF